MILGAEEIYKRLEGDNPILKNFEYEGFTIEGSTVDLRLDEVYKIDQDSDIELFINKRKSAKINKIKLDENGIYTLGQYAPRYGHNDDYYYMGPIYLVDTIEEVNIPTGILVDIKPRTTLFRSGLMLRAANVNPGYHGKLTFMLINFLNNNVKIERGFRICQITFEEIKGRHTKYNGNWQNGRLTSGGEYDPAR